METWGELFWDAWIRLRLWCRSLTRTYWPPHIKAWQICTATGILSVVLTLIALRYQPGAAAGKADSVAGKPVSPKVALASKKLAESSDPFADPQLNGESPPGQELVDDKSLAGVDDMSPDGVVTGDHPDPGFEVPGSRRNKKDQPIGEELAGVEIAQPALSTDLTPLSDTEEAVPEGPLSTEPSLPPDVPENTPAEAPTLAAPLNDAFETPSVADVPSEGTPAAEPVNEPASEPVVETETAPVAETPAPTKSRLIPKRDAKHYSRLGNHEDSEEERHSVQDIRVAPANELPEPVKHAPLVTDIRSKSHYSRLGKHEDSEEDRHSVRNIRPKRVDGVPIPGGAAAQAAAKDAVPAADTDLTPAVPAEENPADNLTLPPAEAVPTEAAPMDPAPRDEEKAPFEPTPARRNPDQDLVTTAQPAVESVVNEPTDEGPAPPVLVAPESPAEESPAKPRDYHGPVLSTDGVDHESHQEEDIFTRTRRKTPVLSELPAAARPSVPTEPPVVERRKPVDPTTAPRTTRRGPPREIHDEEQVRPATEVVVPNSRVVPMAVPDATGPRGPERITVPERMPPVEPSERTAPRGRSESAFAVPPTTQSVRPETAPRLVMDITGPKQAPVGTQVVWHFKIQNLGSAPATGILVSDVLPPGLQHRLSPDLEYAIERLEPGESRETNLTVQCVAAGTITNRAVLRADGDLSTEAEIQIEVGGSAPGSFTPARKSPLTLAHHGPARWLVDSTGQFLVTVTNTSNERQRNVTICQTYPKGTNLVHATIGNKVDQLNRTVTWTIADFAPGASYILETELHCLTSGTGTSSVQVKVGETLMAEDRWTAVSIVADGRP